jgi:hypothetical protein
MKVECQLKLKECQLKLKECQLRVLTDWYILCAD